MAGVYPFERRHYSPSQPLATDREQLVQGGSESANIVSRPKVILVAPVTFGGKRALYLHFTI